MAKRKPLKRKRNPHTPTAKENLISGIITGCLDIGNDIRSSNVQHGLNSLNSSDLQELLGLVDQLLWNINNLKNSGFRFYGVKAGLK